MLVLGDRVLRVTVRALPLPRLPHAPQTAADSIGIGDDLVIAGAHALEGEIDRGALPVQRRRIWPRQALADRTAASGRGIECPGSRAKGARAAARRRLLACVKH